MAGVVRLHEDGIWLVNGFMAAAEAERLIAEAERTGFRESAMWGDGRHNRETFFRSRDLATRLEGGLSGYRFNEQSCAWRVVRIGSLVEAYRYGVGEYITAHSDAACDVDGANSTHALIIYLNDEFSGGGTRFTEQNLAVEASTGRALLFAQHLRHEAVVVTEGTKYILRARVQGGPLG
jgi:hypothetical protein